MLKSSVGFAFVAASIMLPLSAAAAPLCPAGFITDDLSLTLSSELASTVPSATIGFELAIDHRGKEAIRDAAIHVDVVQSSTGLVVDRFEAPQHVTLFAESPGRAEFDWTVPVGTPSDTYTVIASVVPTNMSRADVRSRAVTPRAETEVAVSGEAQSGYVSGISVNGVMYKNRTPVHITEGSAQVAATIANATDGPYRGTLTWNLYAPDASLDDEPLDTTVERVELHPGTAVDISYTLQDTAHDAYYLEGILSDGVQTSYIDVWLTRSDARFAHLDCGATSDIEAKPVRNTTTIVSIVLALLALSGTWYAVEHRRAA